ncbi:MAG: EamA family transporter RarD [Gammaproteobacteria bacterium]|nr:EamA family transporter RarD [Gammaproteobacteria bacterium]
MSVDKNYQQGLIFAVCAYIMWGVAPAYFKLISDVSATEILVHRVLWSFVFVCLIILLTNSWHKVQHVFKQTKKLPLLLITACLIAANWLLFIWAINNDHMLDASLGYYINPLFNVLLGTVFLGEKLRKFQWLAVLLAGIGVLAEIISFGEIPWVSLALATSFGIYGLLRKLIKVDAISGLFIETLFLLPVALFYISFFDVPSLDFSHNELSMTLLLVAAGVVTTLPLLAFSAAAIRIPLSTLGFIQYIGPSLMLLLAVFAYGEVFEPAKGITFAFIWLALVVYSIDGYKNRAKLIS